MRVLDSLARPGSERNWAELERQDVGRLELVRGDVRNFDCVVAAMSGVEAMCDQMMARGPDDSGIHLLPGAGAALALGSRRLSIIDTSPAGHQPMHDPERGTTGVFNGMSYSFLELRTELAGAGERFRRNSDTEALARQGETPARLIWDVHRAPKARGL